MEFKPRLLQLSMATLLMAGLGASMAGCVLFAALFYAGGESCYSTTSGSDFDFIEMLWLSVHTFTTVGYGSTYPICTWGQVLVLLEYYLSLVLSSLVGAVFLFKFLRPDPLVRFSTNCLVLEDFDMEGDGKDKGQHLAFRVARESYYHLLDCQITLKALMRRRNGQGGIVVPLEPVLSEIHDLELWEVFHRVDETSPLYGKLDLLKMVYVRFKAFDTSYKQEVRLSHEYPSSALRLGYKFADMMKPDSTALTPTTLVDHSKLDKIDLADPLDEQSRLPSEQDGYDSSPDPSVHRPSRQVEGQKPTIFEQLGKQMGPLEA